MLVHKRNEAGGDHLHNDFGNNMNQANGRIFRYLLGLSFSSKMDDNVG
jgi:hypothetical protein